MKLEAVLRSLVRWLLLMVAVLLFCTFRQESEFEAGRQIVHELNSCQEPKQPNRDYEIVSASYFLQATPCDNLEQFMTNIDLAYDHYAVGEEYGRVAKMMAITVGILLWLILPLLAVFASRTKKQLNPPT